MDKLAKLGLLPTVAISTAAATAVLSATPAQAITLSLGGYGCPTATCVDFESAGYSLDSIENGAVATSSQENEYLTPGTDSSLAGDPNDSGKVLSYNVTSALDSPEGATDPIKVVDLDGSFEFFWGSVDTYNVVEFFLNGVSQKTFTGFDVAKLLGIENDYNTAGNYEFDQSVSFSGLFDSVKLYNADSELPGANDTLIAFEVAAAKVPEPTSLIGIAAFGILSGASLLSRKKQTA